MAQTGGANARYGLPKAKRSRPAPARRSSGPRSEAAAGGGYGIKKANRFKRTAPFRGAVRKAYTSQPVPVRRQTVRATKGRTDASSRVVQRLHTQRAATDRRQMASQVITPRQRAIVEGYKRSAAYRKAVQDVVKATAPKHRGLLAQGVHLALGAGSLDHKLGSLNPLAITVKTGNNFVESLVGHPKKTVVSTAKQAKEIASATPSALAKSAVGVYTDTKSGKVYQPTFFKEMGKYVGQRAKFYTESSAQQRKDFQHGEAAKVGLDVMGAYGGPGRLLSRGIGKAATKAGADVMTAERPVLRVSGGKTVKQEVAPEYFKAHRQRILDKTRAARQEKRANSLNGRDVISHQAHLENAKANQVVQVTHLRPYKRSRVSKQAMADIQSRGQLAERIDRHQEVTAAAKKIRTLNKHERKGFVLLGTDQVPIHEGPKVIREHLVQMKKDKIAARVEAGDKKGGHFRRSDNVRHIQQILDTGVEKVFTPHMLQVVKDLHPQNIQWAERDRYLRDQQAGLRRAAPSGKTMKLRQGEGIEPPAPAPEPVVVKRSVNGTREADKAVALAKEQLDAAKSPVVDEHLARKTSDLKDARAQVKRMKAIKATKPEMLAKAEARVTRLQKDVAAAKVKAPVAKVAVAPEAVKVAENGHVPSLADVKKRLAHLRMKAGKERKRDGQPSPETAANLAHHEQLLTELQGGTPAKAAAVINGHGELPAMHYNGNETDAAFLQRVHDTAVARGHHGQPLYFPSEKYAFDSGLTGGVRTGTIRAPAAPHQYTGRLQDLGREDWNPAVYLRGLARTIHRVHGDQQIRDQLDHSAFKHFHWTDTDGVVHTTEPNHLSLNEAKDIAARAGLKKGSYAFWNPSLYDERLAAARAVAAREGSMGNEVTDHGVDNASLQDALSTSLVKDASEADSATRGWQIVPHDDFREIHSSVEPPNKWVRRLWDTPKGQASRLLLGSNPSWLAFQVASNAGLAAMATKGMLPVTIAKMATFWHGLDDQQRRDLEPYIAASAGHGDVLRDIHGLEAASSWANGWRSFRQMMGDVPVGPHGLKARHLNPLDWMMHLDHAQNRLFRKTVLYNEIKRQAFKRMGEDASVMTQLQDRFAHALSAGPKDAMEAIMRDPAELDRAAKVADDFLGNYTSYTKTERTAFRRVPMFYGFLRFSLRFLFYTMPVKHPLMTSITGSLGSLQADEVKKLLGGDDMPLAFGRLYWTSHGKLKMFDFSRANPALNQVTSIQSPGQVLGMLPPYVSAALDQVTSRNNFFDRAWAVGSHPKDPRKKPYEYGLADRGRIFGEQMLRMVGPYRMKEQSSSFSERPQGDDSMLFSPRPTQYSPNNKRSRAITASINKEAKQVHAEPHRLLNEVFGGLMPQDSRDVELAARIRANKQAGNSKGKKKKKYLAPNRRKAGRKAAGSYIGP